MKYSRFLCMQTSKRDNSQPNLERKKEGKKGLFWSLDY